VADITLEPRRFAGSRGFASLQVRAALPRGKRFEVRRLLPAAAEGGEPAARRSRANLRTVTDL